MTFMKKPANAPESVQMLPWPEVKEEYINEELETKWDNFIEIRSEITKVLELARRNKQIGHSLDAKVELHAEGEALAILKSVEKDLATLLIVSQAIIVEGAAEGAEATGREDLKVTVAAAEGHKCERCWIYSDEVGQDRIEVDAVGEIPLKGKSRNVFVYSLKAIKGKGRI